MMKETLGLAGVLVALAVGWTPVDAAQIVIANSVECIDIPRQQTVDGTPVSLFNCHGTANRNGPSRTARSSASAANASTSPGAPRRTIRC